MAGLVPTHRRRRHCGQRNRKRKRHREAQRRHGNSPWSRGRLCQAGTRLVGAAPTLKFHALYAMEQWQTTMLLYDIASCDARNAAPARSSQSGASLMAAELQQRLHQATSTLLGHRFIGGRCCGVVLADARPLCPWNYARVAAAGTPSCSLARVAAARRRSDTRHRLPCSTQVHDAPVGVRC